MKSGTMSDQEDTTTLLNDANKSTKPPATSAAGKESDDCIVQQNNSSKTCKVRTTRTKSKTYEDENLTPLTSGDQYGIVSTVACLAGMAVGFDLGMIKPVVPYIKHDFGLSCFEKNFIIDVWFIGALLGSLTGGIFVDYCGRRSMMIISMILLSFGVMLTGLANHYILLLVARVICGYSSTISAVAHCVYIVEVTETIKRGYNIMLYQFGTAAGFFFSLAMYTIVSKKPDVQWRFYIGSTAIFALSACIITIICLQRSKVFLLRKKLTNGPRPSRSNWNTVFGTLAIMCVMFVLQQGTGRVQVLYYAPRLFALLGICSNVAENTASISLSFVRLVSTTLCVIIIERCGRRTALITSATICMTTISLLSLLATIDRGDDNLDLMNVRCEPNELNYNPNISSNQQPANSPPPFPLLPTPLAAVAPSAETWTQIKASCEAQDIALSDGLTGGIRILTVITLHVYEAAYALGLGPVPFLILSEVFPAAVRGRCVSVAVLVMWVFHVIASETVSQLTKSMTLAGAFLFYSFTCLVTIFYVFLFIPETKDRSLHRVAEELRKISLFARMCNNLRSLPLVRHTKWIRKCEDIISGGQSTPI